MKSLTPKIFIVEDDKFYAELIRTSLENENLTNTEHYPSGPTCLENLDKQPDIVILDHMLGSMSGLHVLKEIKRQYPAIQVIFLSAQEEMNIAINALKYGAVDYIEKTQRSAMSRLLLMIDKARESSEALQQTSRFENLKKWFLIH